MRATTRGINANCTSHFHALRNSTAELLQCLFDLPEVAHFVMADKRDCADAVECTEERMLQAELSQPLLSKTCSEFFQSPAHALVIGDGFCFGRRVERLDPFRRFDTNQAATDEQADRHKFLEQPDAHRRFLKSAFKLFNKKEGSSNKLSATVSYNAATKQATLNPTTSLRRGVTYKAVVSTEAKDVAGNPLDQNPTKAGLQQKVWSFTVRR